MPCDFKRDDEGRLTAIVCSRGRRTRPCLYCGRPSSVLCDHVLTEGPRAGKTCDKAMCSACTWRPAPEKDYCRAHRPAPEARP